MNRTKFLKLMMVSFLVMATAAGCKRAPKGVTPIPGTTRTPPGPTQPIGPQGGDQAPRVPTDEGVNPNRLPLDPTGVTQLGPRIERSDYLEDRETLKERTVYFDLDSSAVKVSEKSKVDGVADYLKTQPTFKLEIEGHCDERGTEGYNLSLGERRALSIREYLIAVGIPGERINTITFGESKPAIQGHDEQAWQKNRRGEFLLLKPKTP